MIDINLHRRILLGILKDVYQNRALGAQLGFKGGTCLYFFHDLNRFSVDLDFNLLPGVKHFEAENVENILLKYTSIKDSWSKEHTWLWMGSYKKTHHNVKIEISKRDYSDEYELKDLYGLPVLCMKPEFLFAHKLCAISDRSIMANRDLFDAHFMFSKNFDIAHSIIRERTGMETGDYFKKLIGYISQNLNRRGILDGLAELLDAGQKSWVKEKLVSDLLFYLKSWSA